MFFFLFHWNWNLRWNSKQIKIFPHNKDQFSCFLTQIPNQTGIPNPLCCHLTRTRSTIPSTTNHTAIQHWTTDRIRSSFILAVNAIFVSQLQLQNTRRLCKQRPAAVSTLCMEIVDCDKRASRREVAWKRLRVGRGQVKNGKRENIGIFFFFSLGKPHYKADCITFNSKRRQGLIPEPYTFSFHHSQTDDCMIIVNRHHEWRPQFRPMLNCLESSNSRLSLFSYYCYHYHHHHHHHHHQHHHRYHYLLYFNFWMKFAKERDCKKNKTKQKNTQNERYQTFRPLEV